MSIADKRRYAAAAFIVLLTLSVFWPSPIVSVNRLCCNASIGIDELSFLAPVFVGHLVTASASVNHVGRSSMEVGVRVDAEDLLTGKAVHVASAYLVFVSTDEKGRPGPLPPLLAETDDERRRMKAAEDRRTLRLKRPRTT